jgi:hypothetical protein
LKCAGLVRWTTSPAAGSSSHGNSPVKQILCTFYLAQKTFRSQAGAQIYFGYLTPYLICDFR